MAVRKSTQRKEGRYVQGGTSEMNGNRLGWWERRLYTHAPTDVPYVITKKYAQRPDLLAFDLYGRANLQWFVLQYNHISNVTTEFVEGATLMLPTSQRLFGELLSNSQR